MEYKVASPLGWTGSYMQEYLNHYSKEGWILSHMTTKYLVLVRYPELDGLQFLLAEKEIENKLYQNMFGNDQEFG